MKKENFKNVSMYEETITEKMEKAFGLSTNVATETVGEITTEYYSFFTDKKGKDGKPVSTEIQIRDKKAIATLRNIDVFIGMTSLSIKGLVCEISRLDSKIAKEAVNSDVVGMLSKIYPTYSKTTLQLYRRVGLMFVDRTKDGYFYRAGIPQTVSVNNLSVVLALATKKKNLEELTEKELESLYQSFYADYIATGKINLTSTQSALKKAVHDITESENAIDGSAKDITEEKTEEKTEETEVIEETERKDNIVEFKESLVHFSEIFKGNGNILASISDILKELALLEENND